MGRFAREAVLIMDPAKAALTRVAVKLGIAEDIEEAGNQVKRLEPAVVAEILRDCGFGDIGWRRTLMYYPHRPGRWFQLLGKPPLFLASRGLFEATNLVLGRLGNKLAMGAVRS